MPAFISNLEAFRTELFSVSPGKFCAFQYKHCLLAEKLQHMCLQKIGTQNGWCMGHYRGYQGFGTEDQDLTDFQGTHSGELLTSDATHLQLLKNGLEGIQIRV